MKTKLALTFMITVMALLMFFNARSSSQSISRSYIVKLYAGEKVIGTWQARDMGTIEGESLTFVVKGDFDITARRVRIQGVYTVEEFQ